MTLLWLILYLHLDKFYIIYQKTHSASYYYLRFCLLLDFTFLEFLDYKNTGLLKEGEICFTFLEFLFFELLLSVVILFLLLFYFLYL